MANHQVTNPARPIHNFTDAANQSQEMRGVAGPTTDRRKDGCSTCGRFIGALIGRFWQHVAMELHLRLRRLHPPIRPHRLPYPSDAHRYADAVRHTDRSPHPPDALEPTATRTTSSSDADTKRCLHLRPAYTSTTYSETSTVATPPPMPTPPPASDSVHEEDAYHVGSRVS